MLRNTVAAALLFLAVACSDPTGSKPRGDPWTITVTHAHLTDAMAKHYDLCIVVDDAGPAAPSCTYRGGWDSVDVANGIDNCGSVGTDSLGARIIWMEFRSSAPSPVGDTVRSIAWDPAAIPSADSALGYGQSPTKPYIWHWYVSNDSNVVRGDTARFIQDNGQPCTF